MASSAFSPARFLNLSLCLCVLCLAAPAQITPVPENGPANNSGQVAAAARPAPEIKTYTLSGTVVNSETGQGIPHAMVEVGPVAALTDSSGSFTIEGIAAGTYYVNAQKPGYFNVSSMAPQPPPMVQLGPDSQPVTVPLSPEAVIYGHITDSDGLPVQHLSVQIMRSMIVEGRRDWQPQGMKETDEDGYYRIAGLQPGIYLLVAGPSQMPSIAAMAKTGQQNSGYGQVFYPAPADNGATGGMHVSAGQKITADMSVDAEPFYSITGTLNAPQGTGVWLNMTPRSNIHVDRGQAFMRGENNTFTINMIPRGDYILHAGAQVQGKQWNAFVPLHVAGDINGLPVVLEPAVSIPISTRVERTQPTDANTSTPRPALIYGPSDMARARGVPLQPPPVQVGLRSIDNPQQQYWSGFRPPQQVGESAKFSMENVPPGTYKVEFRPNGDLYVASARYGSTDLLRENLLISHYAGTDAIDVTLRDDGGKVKVKIAGDTDVNGTARTSPQFLVVPDHGPPYVPNSQGFSSTEGYTFGNIRPGSYSILAFEDDVNRVEYTNADALEPYMSKAAHVDVAAGQEASVTLELQKAVAQ